MAKSLSIGQLLNKSSGGIAQILQRAKTLRKLTTKLRQMVDAPINDHIFVVNIRDKTLIIGIDSAVWHARIKYLAPVILDQMKQVNGLEQLQEIEFRVQPANAHLTQTNPPKKNDTEQNYHGDLQQVLQRLKEKTKD